VNIGQKRMGRTATARGLCTAVLLAMLAVSVHVCGSQVVVSGGMTQVTSVSAGGGPCLICLMRQPGTTVVPVLALLLLAPAGSLFLPFEQPLRLLPEGFWLYIRPPPAN
jgi:hypothetical protein